MTILARSQSVQIFQEVATLSPGELRGRVQPATSRQDVRPGLGGCPQAGTLSLLLRTLQS